MIRREEIIGDCRLLLGDCLEILPTLGKVDAVVTDPPYGIGWDYASYVDTFENWQRLIDGLVPMAVDASQAMSLSVGPMEAELHILANHKPSWRACWYRGSTGARSPFGFRDYETVFLWGTPPKPMHDFFHIPPEPERFGHTCPKPVRYAEWLVSRLTNEGGLVCDPFLGSGTTGVGCTKLGRKFIGIEIDEGYFDIACERIRKAYAQPDMFIERAPEPRQGAMF